MMDNKSRMSREAHVRFCEKLGLKCPCLLDSSLLKPFLKRTPLFGLLTNSNKKMMKDAVGTILKGTSKLER